MQTAFYPIVDSDGQRGTVSSCPSDVSRLEVRLDGGQRLFVPRALVTDGPDQTYRFGQSFAALLARAEGGEIVVPVVEEQVEITKRLVERDHVRLTKSTTTRDEVVDVPLVQEEIAVERVPVGRVVAEATAPRQEGDTLVVPVYEEVLVVEKRLVLREEIRLTRVRHERREPQHVQLRREEARIERIPPSMPGT